MIVALFFYHCFLIYTCQTTKEHLKRTYQLDPNPHYKHPFVSCWNLICKNNRSSFTCNLFHCGPPKLFQEPNGNHQVERSPPEALQNSIDKVTIAEDQDYQYVIRTEIALDGSAIVKTV